MGLRDFSSGCSNASSMSLITEQVLLVGRVVEKPKVQAPPGGRRGGCRCPSERPLGLVTKGGGDILIWWVK
ncbi:unnamed protein product [Boreogadus saida]